MRHSYVVTVFLKGGDGIHHVGVPVFSDFCQRSIFLEKRIATDKPRPCRVIAFGIRYLPPCPVRHARTSLIICTRNGSVTLGLAMGKLAVFGTDQSRHQRRPEVHIQLTHRLVNIQLLTPTVLSAHGAVFGLAATRCSVAPQLA